MTNRDNDDLAAALAGLQGGAQHDPDDPAHPHDTAHGAEVHLEGVTQPPSSGVPPVAPAVPPAAADFRRAALDPASRSTRPASPAQRGTRPAAPGASAPSQADGGASARRPAPTPPPAVPTPPGGSATSSRPSRNLNLSPSSRRPAAPGRPASPSAPAAPEVPAGPANPAGQPDVHAMDVTRQADAMAHVVEDGDSVNVPPPPVEYLGHTHPHHPQAGEAGPLVPRYQKLDYRQTLIPVLLTAGLCLFALGATKWLCAPDTRLGAQPVWMAIVWLAVGGVALILGVLNMIQVKVAMERGGR